MTKRIVISIVLILVALLAGFESRYPASWDNIELGMPSDAVRTRLGKAVDSQAEWKGDFWTHDSLLTEHILNVSFRAGKATKITIERRIGTGEHSYMYFARIDATPMGEPPSL